MRKIELDASVSRSKPRNAEKAGVVDETTQSTSTVHVTRRNVSPPKTLDGEHRHLSDTSSPDETNSLEESYNRRKVETHDSEDKLAVIRPINY